MNRRLTRYLAMIATLSTAFAIVLSASAQQITASGNVLLESPNGIYIVQMIDEPVVAYKGGIKGLKATKPNRGKKIDPDSKAVVKYVAHLNAKHAKALSKVGGKKVYNYNYSFNGFAARMSHEQAKQLQKAGGVVAVSADELRTLDTVTTPDFLELTASGGLWDMGVKGEDIIIGIVDGGIWPESLSFTDRTGSNGNGKKDGKLDYQHMPIWHGECRPGEAWTSANCNQKLIGARYYNEGFDGDAGIDATMPWEFNSPRDWGGHGSHTASTAGGNEGTPLTGDASFFGTASGMAPRARIAAYKVCFDDGTGGSCWAVDSVAAIDQAVADGVDVINYSIGGSRTNFLDAVEVAFLYAADAGIFVTASAGNSGPGASTVAHPGPWLTTVANSTHDRSYDADVTLGNLDVYSGSSVNTKGAGPTDLVYSADVGMDGAVAEEVRLCYPGTLDPALVTGKIVLCDRGEIARVDKSLAVFMAGGVGSILANPNAGQSQNADFHSVPTVHVDNVSGDAIRDYIAAESSPTAEISTSRFAPKPAPFISVSSSRGPLLAGEGDLLKPDVSAPGSDVLAAVAPPGNDGQDFALYSGTSMSSPHVAGMGALMKELHPGWSPMMIKSAFMTTGYDLLSGADPFAQGAGHVDPNSAADPGLVYDHGWIDWLDFLFDGGTAYTDLNGASIATGSMLSLQTVSRTVTSVGSSSETYEFSYSVPGIDIVATPDSFTIDPGDSQSFDLDISVNGATPEVYTSGFIYWTGDDGHVVRSPVVVRPTAISADLEVDGVADGAGDGSVDVDVQFGYDGVYTASVSGLLASDSTGSVNLPGPQGNSHLWCYDIPANTHVRIATFDEDTSDPGFDDIDLDVLRGDADCDTTTVFVARFGSSGGETSEEVVDIPNGPAASYFIFVDFFAASNGSDTDYNLWIQTVLGDEANTLLTTPAGAVLGASDTVTVDYTGLAPTRHLGILHHEDGGGEIARTILDIDAQP